MNGTNGTNGVKSPKPVFPAEALTKEYAVSLDKTDPLRALRDEFIIPSKANLASKKLAKPGKTRSLEPLKLKQISFLLVSMLMLHRSFQ